jgi:alkaline phosphatase
MWKKKELKPVNAVLKIFALILCSLSFAYPQEIPRNIIILIGDGMGLSYVSANVITDGDNPFKKFTSVGLSLTSSSNRLITDSGAGATAISTGQRTYNLAIGVDTNKHPIRNIFEAAEELNKSTGVIATSSVTHATPASFVAHVPDRGMELQIARQFFDSRTDVVIGGGSSFFTSMENVGKRGTGDHLIDSIINKGYNYYGSYKDLQNSSLDKPFYALIEKEALQPASERNYKLSNLLSSALRYLKNDKDGFVLMVEGSQIDWAAHNHDSEELMAELTDFSGAINLALQFADLDKNTLVVVTADHETGGGSINGGDLNGENLQLEYTSNGHTAEMVGIFAKGPGEELFRGIMKNSQMGLNFFQFLLPH